MAAIVIANGKQQYFDDNGDPLVGGKVYTYAAGTLSPKYTYSSSTVSVPTRNTNPVILDARGEATIFWDGAYKVVLTDSLDNEIWTVDNVSTEVEVSTIVYSSTPIDTLFKDYTPHVVSNIIDLKAVDKTKFTQCFVQGYYADGDGGGGMYYYDSGDTTSVDNGGTIIVATDGGRWKLMTFGQPYSVLQFGAKPDYITDATSAIQDAIDALGAEGGIVTVEGSFRIADLTINSNVTLRGNNGAPAQIASGTYGPTNHPSVLVLSSANTITMESGGRLEGLLVLESDLAPGATYALPLSSGNAAAAVSNFAGSAITLSDPCYNAELVNCIFLGFDAVIDNTAASQDISILADTVIFDCTSGIKLYIDNTDNLSVHRDCRAFPLLTAHLSIVARNVRTGTAFYCATGRSIYENCDAREISIAFDSDNSFTQHIGCSVKNDDSTANSFIGYRYTGGGYSVTNTSCLALNCGGGNIISNMPSVGGVNTGLSVIGALLDNQSVASSTTGLIRIVDGNYSITGCMLGFNGVNSYIYLDSTADYGTVSNNSFFGTVQPITGDSSAILRCRIGNNSYRDSTPVLQPMTWTPVLKAGANTQTLSASYGHYTITNSHVTLYFDILMSSKVGTGVLTITGSPFTAANETNTMIGVGSISYYDNTAALTSHPTCAVAKNTAVIDLYDFSATGVATIDDTNLTNTTRLVGWVTFRIAN